MTNYSMSGRTYRYFEGDPLYPFGYGLSYTTFHYFMLSNPTSITAGDTLTGQIQLTNTGSLDADEVSTVHAGHKETRIEENC
jgi:beta-glucosidase